MAPLPTTCSLLRAHPLDLKILAVLSTNLLTMYQLCTGLSREETLAACGEMRWGEFKPALTDAVVSHLSPIQSRYFEIMEEPGYLDGVLARGADAANEVAEKTVADVRDAMGFLERA